MTAAFTALEDTGLIALEGADALAFLQAQLTSDVAGLAEGRTQYSGYCSPKGRLLAIFLLWKEGGRIILQLPCALREPLQARLAKYVLRAKVRISDATATEVLFGCWGDGADAAALSLTGRVPAAHEIVHADGAALAGLGRGRYLVRVAAAEAASMRARLAAQARATTLAEWARCEVEAGIPVVMPQTQDAFVPQMTNLDLLGGVSFAKGCYPGQEIVARTHYLGRLKQRMYRLRFAADSEPTPGEPLYSAAFGDAQASGAIVRAAPTPGGGFEALAVIQTAAATSGDLRLRAPDGPPATLLDLPYVLPA